MQTQFIHIYYGFSFYGSVLLASLFDELAHFCHVLGSEDLELLGIGQGLISLASLSTAGGHRRNLPCPSSAREIAMVVK